MSNYVSINVELIFKERVIDLRVPRLVSRWQLRKVLVEALENIGVRIPVSFRIEIGSKSFGTDGSTLFDEIAIGDGDQIVIVEEF